MNFGDHSTTLLTFVSTIVFSFVSAIIPVVNMEVYVVFLGSVAPPSLLPALLMVGTLSHMLGKSCMYLAARSVERLPPGRFKDRITATKAKLDTRKGLGGAVIFVSSLTGIPPFYLVTVTSGVLRFNFPYFFLIGFLGRLIRFGALIVIPELVRAPK